MLVVFNYFSVTIKENLIVSRLLLRKLETYFIIFANHGDFFRTETEEGEW